MDRVDVERRGAGPFGRDRHGGVSPGQKGAEHGFDLVQHRAHMADRAVAQKGHGAMGDAAPGFHLGPPDAAMAQADAVLVQRFGDDDVLDPVRVKPALSGQPGYPAEAAGFLIRSGADFDGPAKAGVGGNKGFGGDDAGSKPPLHVAGAAPIDAVADQLCAEGIARPAMADLDHVVMAVEMHAVTGTRSLQPGDQVPARVCVAVARCALRADEFDAEAGRQQPGCQIVADPAIVLTGRVQCGDADQILRQADQVLAAGIDGKRQRIGHGGRLPRGGRSGNAACADSR